MQRNFLRGGLFCLVPCLIAGFFVVRAYMTGGFKPGVDLSGGTILIYEVDQEREAMRKQVAGNAGDDGKKLGTTLAEALKRRLDPTDLFNLTIRPVGENRVEIILPTGGGTNRDGKQNLTAAEVDKVKKLIEKVGSLEFQIVANTTDDAKGYAAAEEYYASAATDAAKRTELISRARRGVPPAMPNSDEWTISTKSDVTPRKVSYAWVELSKLQREAFGLLNKNADLPPAERGNWQLLADARGDIKNPDTLGTTGKALRLREANRQGSREYLIYGRPCLNTTISEKERNDKKFEYFILMRSSDRVQVDGSNVTVSATSGTNPRTNLPAIDFQLNSEGGRRFYELTSVNGPTTGDKESGRDLAIILDGELISHATINEAISNKGQISGNFDADYVNEIVRLLRSGALPATLKRLPVSENTIGPTLGADTIKSGTRAVGLAFVAILVFMIVYYRFAGIVASIALLANLLLTIGFMVGVNATFTLPGLAGLALMLGMAVDANVLIYERLREERERGANLAMAIRNAYDRAFPTIIDTHLSSIFTAVVLYAVGNDQLKGFGVSLTAGLVISLFTSLYMTRLIFDFGLRKGWLTNLKMMKLFSKPNIDFMKIRKAMFAATALLTIAGLGLFISRGSRGLNVDFIGGTVYGGQLQSASDIGSLRALLQEDRQASHLNVQSVTLIPGAIETYELNYADGSKGIVELAQGAIGATPEEKLADVKARASHVPDWSVEQNFLSDSTGNDSKYFTVRTTEKEPSLVQVAIGRLFSDDTGKSLLAQVKITPTKEGSSWTLKLTDAAGAPTHGSVSYIKSLLDRQFRTLIDANVTEEPTQLSGVDAPVDGRHAVMQLTLSTAAANLPAGKADAIINGVLEQFSRLPQPERLETFDSTLAGETRARAFYAIVASWAAILIYLWFRFGSWTFGAAAVVCLIHDLCFTLGAIALCHYISDTLVGKVFTLQDFKIDLPTIAALLTLVGYSVNDTIVVFDRIREVRGKNPLLTEQMINQSVNQTLSRTILASLTTWLVVVVLYLFGGDGVHLFSFVMVVGVLVGTYSSIYIASPLLLIFGEGTPEKLVGGVRPVVAVAKV